MDTVLQADGKAAPVPGNRISQRPSRRGNSKFAHPLLTVQQLTANNTRPIGAGVDAAHAAIVRESPTFYNFFREDIGKRNRYPDQIFLYDWSRVVLKEAGVNCDYYHASYVDGIDQKRQYALAQVPYNALTAADFHRLLAQLKPDVVVVLMPRAADECKLMIPAKKGDSKSLAGITLRVEAEEAAASGKSETVAVAVSGGSTGVWTAKFCFLNAWKAETNLPRVELADFRTLLVLCPSGAWRCGVWMMYDSECERMQKYNKLRFTESLRQLRAQRHGALGDLELFSATVNALAAVAKTHP